VARAGVNLYGQFKRLGRMTEGTTNSQLVDGRCSLMQLDADFSNFTWRLFKRVLAGGLAAGLTGCIGMGAVGPDYQEPAPSVPSEWQVSSLPGDVFDPTMPPSLTRWWQQFGDADLDWLIDTALADDLSIAQARARLQQVRANRTQAVSALYPEIGASLRATPTYYGAPESERPDTTQYDAEFDAAWEIDIFGGTRRSIEAAQADTQSSEAALANIRVSVAAEVAQNYVDLRNSQERLSIAKRNMAFQAETLQMALWRHQAGLARQTDVAQARASLEQTRASLPDLEIERARANNRLSVLTGQAPGAVNQRLSNIKPLPLLPATIATGIPMDALTQRPDLRVAERNLAAETARIGQTMAKRYPSLNLGGSLGWTAFTLSGLGPTNSLIGVLTGALSATLFDGGRLRSQVDAQTAVQEQALLSYEQTVLQVLEEVENALTSHAFSRQRVQAWSFSAQASASAAQQSRQLYQSGLVDFEQVLITERSQLNAQESLALAQATEFITLIQLYKALGGGWQDMPAAVDQPVLDNTAS